MPGEPLIFTKQKQPLNYHAMLMMHLSRLENLKLIKSRRIDAKGAQEGPNPSKGQPTSYSLHEFRDVATSFVEITAREKGFNTLCAEFFMGHAKSIDPNQFNKFYKLDPGCVERQYQVAEPYLNIIISNPTRTDS